MPSSSFRCSSWKSMAIGVAIVAVIMSAAAADEGSRFSVTHGWLKSDGSSVSYSSRGVLSVWGSDGLPMAIDWVNGDLREADVESLVRSSDSSKKYFLRVANDDGTHVQTAVPLCSLASAISSGKLKEKLRVSVSDDGTAILGVDLLLPHYDCADDVSQPSSLKQKRKAYVTRAADSMEVKVDASSYRMRGANAGGMRGSKQSGEDAGEAAPQQSFLQKYWMYLLPAGLMLFAGQLAPDPEQLQRMQQQQQQRARQR